ncbi:MAG: sugar phosphate isomerase/epimerase [Lachnospiraceae bacterium]|nr:sugar phosphate isomerase/epimerase [Lachnospiraceae bacterium]
MKRWEIGVGTGGTRKKITEEVFDELGRLGFKHMEFALCHIAEYDDPDVKTTAITSHDVEKIKAAAARNGVNIWSLHIPFGHDYYDISCNDRKKRVYAVEKYGEMIGYAAKLGAQVVVAHPSFEPIEESERSVRLENARDSLNSLAKVAKECGVTLAVENLPRTCLGRDTKEMLYLLSADESLRVCFDVNHLLRESHKDFVAAVGHKIATIHLSDYDFVDERHWLLGTGKIDCGELISLLKGIGYQGPFMNEVRGSLETEIKEKYTFREIYENSVALLDKYFDAV